eukprot:CAMPEP_0197523602 /NCGR_PEP_ID=MMETSP1318-20131121/8507_1 /TAXON_ID=552666 /ORGANISM="Partenskyella glossopodia, Strain RCC365" /LENGTH=86 /DNA_ID=CAMNT_0043076349 /DNA_START=32 /DNA_END=288 /DNA_ORIENTATION=+
MTSQILQTLGFKFNVYTPKMALEDLLRKMGNQSEGVSKLTALFSHYFIDLSMHCIELTSVYPSTVAVACLLAAKVQTAHSPPASLA